MQAAALRQRLPPGLQETELLSIQCAQAEVMCRTRSQQVQHLEEEFRQVTRHAAQQTQAAAKSEAAAHAAAAEAAAQAAAADEGHKAALGKARRAEEACAEAEAE